MSSYTVRSVIQWPERSGQKRAYIYEERITVWNAGSISEAIEKAESEAKLYAADNGFKPLDLFQAYALFVDIKQVNDGTELFSLLRDSDLDPTEYLNTFFDTDYEHQGEYQPTATAEQESAPNP